MTSLSANLRISSRMIPASPRARSRRPGRHGWNGSARSDARDSAFAGGYELSTSGCHARGYCCSGQPEIGRTHDLALAHGNAALDLSEIFAEADAQQLLDLTEARRPASARHRRRAAGPPRHRSQARRAHGSRAARDRAASRPAFRPSRPVRTAAASASRVSAAPVASRDRAIRLLFASGRRAACGIGMIQTRGQPAVLMCSAQILIATQIRLKPEAIAQIADIFNDFGAFPLTGSQCWPAVPDPERRPHSQ